MPAGIPFDLRMSATRSAYVFSLNDPLKELQFSQKIVLADDKFHGCADLEMGGGSGARDPLRRGEIREYEII